MKIVSSDPDAAERGTVHPNSLPAPDTQVLQANASSLARAWALRVAGTLLFIALLIVLDVRGTLRIGDILSALAGANLVLVVLSVALYVPFLVVKAARWRLVSADMRMPMSWGEAWRIYAIGLAAGTFTPGQAGDAVKAWYMQRMGYSLARGLGGAALDRLFDVAVLAALGLLGVAVFGSQNALQTPLLLAWIGVCMLGLAFFTWERTRVWATGLVMSRLARFSKGQGSEGASGWSLQPGTLLYAGLLTGASFATSIFRVWLLAGALGIWLGPLQVSGFVGLTTAAALVPVTVGGLGTRDAVAALAFTQLGLDPAQGIAVSALILLLNLAQAVVGWVVWLKYRAIREESA